MRLEELVSKYIASAEHVFSEIEFADCSIKLERHAIEKVLDLAKAYLEDSKYYRDKNKFEVSLASVAYCEGLLDALRLLGAVRFEWAKRRVEREK